MASCGFASKTSWNFSSGLLTFASELFRHYQQVASALSTLIWSIASALLKVRFLEEQLHTWGRMTEIRKLTKNSTFGKKWKIVWKSHLLVQTAMSLVSLALESSLQMRENGINLKLICWRLFGLFKFQIWKCTCISQILTGFCNSPAWLARSRGWILRPHSSGR